MHKLGESFAHQAPNVFRNKFLKYRRLKLFVTPIGVIIDGERSRPSRMIAPTQALEHPCLQDHFVRLFDRSYATKSHSRKGGVDLCCRVTDGDEVRGQVRRAFIADARKRS